MFEESHGKRQTKLSAYQNLNPGLDAYKEGVLSTSLQHLMASSNVTINPSYQVDKSNYFNCPIVASMYIAT